MLSQGERFYLFWNTIVSFEQTNKRKKKKERKKFLQNYKYVVYEFKYLTLDMTQAFP